MTKVCSKCDIEKSLDNYSEIKFPNNKTGLRSQCKSCISEYGKQRNLNRKEENKQYYLDNRERDKITKHLYYENNKEEYNIKGVIYRENNRDVFQKATSKWIKNNPNYHKTYRKKRYKTDPDFKLRILLGCRLNELFKKSKVNKNNKTALLLGCKYEDARIHLEKQFKPEWNWSNHGQIWEIDHIIPCSSFDLSNPDQQKICFHFTNLQPLFKTTEIAESFGYYNEIGNRNKLNKII